MAVSDVTLLRRWAAQQDAEAFTELVRRHSAMVYGTCLRVLRNSADAEDATQDCFLNLVRLAQEQAPLPASLGGWLHTVAVRRALDSRRSQSRRQAHEDQVIVDPFPSDDPDYSDLLDKVDGVIAELPESLRGPLVRHFLEGRTHREVAKELGLPRRTVTSRIARAVEEVRERLGHAGLGVSTEALASALAGESSRAVPAWLSASLGKVAVIGKAGGASVAVPTLAGVGGIMVGMKKVAVLAAVALLLLTGWYVWEATRSSATAGESAPAVAPSRRRPPAAVTATPPATKPLVKDETAASAAEPEPPVGDPDVAAAVAAPALPEQVKEGDEAAEGETGILEGTVWVGNEPLADESLQLRYVDAAKPVTVNTNAEGFYRFEGLRGGEVEVTAAFRESTREYRSVERRALVEPGLTTRVDFSFGATGTLEGVVRFDGKTPGQCLVHAELLQPAGGVEKYDARADAQGSYRFDAISEGTLAVTASVWDTEGVRRKRRNMADVQPDSVTRLDFDIDSAQGCPVVGNVTGLAEGNRAVALSLPGAVEIPPTMTLVQYRQIEGASMGGAALAPPGGEFRIDGLEPGTYTVVVVAVSGSPSDVMDGWRAASATVTAEEGREARIDFDFTGNAPPPVVTNTVEAGSE